MTARHTRWFHLRVKGDQQVALQHMPAARKLLGQVLERARLGGIEQFKAYEKQPDGTKMVAYILGGQPIVDVETPPLAPEEALPTFLRGFVVWPRTHADTDGVDDEYPEIVLQPPTGGDGTWRTWFFRTYEPYWEQVEGTKHLYEKPYPDGLLRAGNIDWIGKAPEFLSVSWYGPYTRYWGMILPGAPQNYVFAQGKAIFHGPTYNDEIAETPDSRIEWRVRGAAMRKIEGAWWLYVMHQNTSPNTQHALIRYRLDLRKTTLELGDWAISNDYVIVWTGAVAQGGSFWFFNASCTEASSVARGRLEGTASEQTGRIYTLSVAAHDASLFTESLANFDFLHYWGSTEVTNLGQGHSETYNDFECGGCIFIPFARYLWGWPGVSPSEACPPFGPMDNFESNGIPNSAGGGDNQDSICAVDYDGDVRVLARTRVTNMSITATGSTIGLLTMEASASGGECVTGECHLRSGSGGSSGSIETSTNNSQSYLVELVLPNGTSIPVYEFSSTVNRSDTISGTYTSLLPEGGTLEETCDFAQTLSASGGVVRDARFLIFADLRNPTVAFIHKRIVESPEPDVVVTGSCMDPCDTLGTAPSFTITSNRMRAEIYARGDWLYGEYKLDDALLPVPSYDTGPFVHFSGGPTSFFPYEDGVDVIENILLTPDSRAMVSIHWSDLSRGDWDSAQHFGCWLWLDNYFLWSQPMVGFPGVPFQGVHRFMGGNMELAPRLGFTGSEDGLGAWPGWVLPRGI